MIEKTIEQINKEALGKVNLAGQILNKIKYNPKLVYAHDPALSALREPRQNKFFIMNTLTQLMEMYMTENTNNIPEQVQNFVEDANRFLYGGSN
jgi:hypothetical protein